MQLFSDLFSHSRNERDLDRAIEELQAALPIAALQSIVAERKRKHRAYNQLQVYLERAVAAQIRRENASTP